MANNAVQKVSKLVDDLPDIVDKEVLVTLWKATYI
jgi:hypothetical protein